MSEKRDFWMRRNDDAIRYRVWSRKEGRFVDGATPSLAQDGRLVMSFNGDDDCIVQEYTGTKDIGGYPICEGDILETDEAGWIGVVVFGCGCFIIEDAEGGYSWMPSWSGCRIIGNILENPDRL